MALTLAHADALFSRSPLLSEGLRALATPVPAVRAPSGHGWRCATGVHRGHRSERRAQQCEFAALPMVGVLNRAFDEAVN